MSQAQLQETEQAREQARLAAQRFERIRQAQQAQHGELPQTPRGRPPESIPHRKIEVKELPKAQPPFIGPKRAAKPSKVRVVKVSPPPRRRGLRRPKILGPLLVRQPHARPRLRQDTPANISKAEKDKALQRLDAAIAVWNRKYAFRVVHGGTPQEKQEAAVKLRDLQGERDAIAAMKPLGLPEHIRRAEFHE